MPKLSEIDPAGACLDSFRHSKEKTFQDISVLSSIPESTLAHRSYGRLPKRKSASFQRYLTLEEEEVFVKSVSSIVQNGYRFRTSFIGKIAHHIKRQRNSALSSHKYDPESDDINPPGRNWSATFQKRYPELMRACCMRKSKKRSDQHLYDSIDAWLQLIGPKIDLTKILNENIYNVIATAGVIKFPSIITNIIRDDAIRAFLKANDKGRVCTAIECTSAVGGILDPVIVWPAETFQRNLKLHPTLDLHGEQSIDGYINSNITFNWIAEVFEPQTARRANGKQRLLISDALANYNTHDLRMFCDKKRIILCQPHSLVAQKLQPTTGNPFDQFQITLQEALEQACNQSNNRETTNFTRLYRHARDNAYKLHTTPLKEPNAPNESVDFDAEI